MKLRTFALMSLLSVGTAQSSASDEAMFWNDVARTAIKNSSTPPPMVARHLAVSSIAQYDAVNSIGGFGVAYAYSGSASSAGADKAAAVASAAYHSLRASFGSQASYLDSVYQSRIKQLGDSVAVQNGIRVGRESAEAILAMRAGDYVVAHTQSPYTGGTGAGQWRPTGMAQAPGALPNWGAAPTFAIESGSVFRPGSIDLASKQYADAYNQVKSLGALNSTTRTTDQTNIAKFWIGGPGTSTPPGQWNEIATQIARTRNLTLDQSVRMYGALNVALADAGIAAWDTKYSHSMWRPETAIHNGDIDGNAATIGDTGWTPLVTTPNHPTFTSGHSTFSAAGATVLGSIFGNQTAFCYEAEGTTRHFKSFTQAAEEAGMSRIYGGIHFSFDNEVGLDMGNRIGRHVLNTRFQAVPEPATVAALGLGVAAMLRRRKKS